jgi:hypothetical protein
MAISAPTFDFYYPVSHVPIPADSGELPNAKIGNTRSDAEREYI